MSLSRRSFLGAAAATGFIAAGTAAHANASSLSSLSSSNGFGQPGLSSGRKKAPLLNNIVDDQKLALPKGFKANRVSTIGVEDLLDDKGGAVVGKIPSNLDGTGAIPAAAGTILIRNHECRSNADVPVPLVEGTIYDAGCATGMGGNTNVEVDAMGNFVQQWVALSGTIRNCAGGETPWGTWLACEEDTTKAGTEVVSSVDGKTYVTEKDHGYVFEVFPGGVADQLPMPIKAWGRAVWEGAAIDPSLTKAYITEDTGGGLFYRWIAPEGTKIGARIAEQFGENDGILQAAKLVKDGKDLIHYSELTEADKGKAYPVTWVHGGEDRQAQNSDLRAQFPGATVHPKIEGCWPDANGLWFTLSYTNQKQLDQYPSITELDSGMIMYYSFADETLTLKEYYPADNSMGGVVPNHPTEEIKQFHGPDNITVTPWGGVVTTEDGDNPCSLIAYNDSFGSREIARDLADRGEWAGPAFDKSGMILFASVQGDCTYAISGPFVSICK
ncbi:DUF839 domain-containing protein [Corynebacterium breve]|uniref:DUF839 domain-containing protein n=1 Tax=Corynebacterium breve TaxID=3049799 RepID=A0ABY8VG95_9CORY|nr:alkaline phosphatase PhoX [Corynebacterium breve]WIM68686.1 DUF839 domain-containing protein [Corynebacterium breve]